MAASSARFDLMPIWAKWMLTLTCPLLVISIGGVGATGTNKDQFDPSKGMVSPEWFHFWLTILVVCFLTIIFAIFLFFGRMVWVLNKSANIDLERRVERDRIAAARFQEYKNAGGPAYWQGRLDGAGDEAARRASADEVGPS